MPTPTTKLQYGGKTLELFQHEKLVAARPQPGRDEAMRAEASLLGAHDLATTLGGFELMRVDVAQRDAAFETLMASSPVAGGATVYRTQNEDTPIVPTGEIYVVFGDGTTDQDCRDRLAQQRLEVVEVRGPKEFITRVSGPSDDPVQVAAKLQEAPEVQLAEPDLATQYKLTELTLPTDELLSRQWHLENRGDGNGGDSIPFKKGADARVVEAWRIAGTLGDPSAVIAVIDDGFDLQHPELNGPGRIVAPWDFASSTNEPSPKMTANGLERHGTACAGVALAAANGAGVVGAAPGVRWMPLGLDELSDRNIELYFRHATQMGAWVVSCSWKHRLKAFGLSKRKQDAIADCARFGRGGRGCVIVFAAGNDEEDIAHPAGVTENGFATHEDVIAVAASNSLDQRSHYSNYGKAISVCAPSNGWPGAGVTTTDLRGPAGFGVGAYTNDFGGTSSSTPLVAGIAALVLSTRPELTSAQVKHLLQRTARRMGDLTSYDASGHSPYHGYGCVDAAAAVRQALGAQPPIGDLS